MGRLTCVGRAALLGGLLAAALAGKAQALDMKFTLDWAFQGPTAAFIVARDLGYYKDAGLNVTIDRGNGSAGAIQSVATGAYQMGFADVNALVEFNVANPGQAAKAVMIVYDAPPFGIYVLKKSGITKPQEVVGKKLGAPVFDASYKLFPAFAAKIGIDPAAVPRVNMAPPLREAMLARGEVDVISGHYFSSMLDLQAKGVAQADIVPFLYKDYGMDFYGNAVIASGRFMAEQPDAVRKFNAATIKGMRWVIANRDKAVDMVAVVDPLIDKQLERTRLEMAITMNIVTPYVQANGMGAAEPARLETAIKDIVSAVGLKSTPAVADIWSGDFLPADRKITD